VWGRLRHNRGAWIAACCAVAFACGAPGAGAADDGYQTQVAQLESTEQAVVQSYMDRSGPTDPRYYQDGIWSTGDDSCWYCWATAGTAAAVLSRQGSGDAAMRQVAIDTINRAIDDQQQPDGSFAAAPNNSAGIVTNFFTVEVGVAYLELRGQLDAATSARWASSVKQAVDYMIRNGEPTWYTNGNMNLRLTEDLWLAWQATGDTHYRDLYESEWSFTVAPSQARWQGFGLQITRNPTRADGADGAGYLAESGGGAPGYDPEYTMVQMNIAAQMYALSRDPRFLRLANLEMNQLLPRVDSSWTLDATGGSRHSLKEPFTTSAMAVLVHSGTRPDLAAMLAGQLGRLELEYRGAMTYTHPNYYKGLDQWLSTVLIDAGQDAAAPAPAPTLSAPTTISAGTLTTQGVPTTVTTLPTRSQVQIVLVSKPTSRKRRVLVSTRKRARRRHAVKVRLRPRRHKRSPRPHGRLLIRATVFEPGRPPIVLTRTIRVV
jgi:hypothetical protein